MSKGKVLDLGKGKKEKEEATKDLEYAKIFSKLQKKYKDKPKLELENPDGLLFHDNTHLFNYLIAYTVVNDNDLSKIYEIENVQSLLTGFLYGVKSHIYINDKDIVTLSEETYERVILTVYNAKQNKLNDKMPDIRIL